MLDTCKICINQMTNFAFTKMVLGSSRIHREFTICSERSSLTQVEEAKTILVPVASPNCQMAN